MQVIYKTKLTENEVKKQFLVKDEKFSFFGTVNKRRYECEINGNKFRLSICSHHNRYGEYIYLIPINGTINRLDNETIIKMQIGCDSISVAVILSICLFFLILLIFIAFTNAYKYSAANTIPAFLLRVYPVIVVIFVILVVLFLTGKHLIKTNRLSYKKEFQELFEAEIVEEM